MQQALAIINPAAAAGKASKKWLLFKSAFHGVLDCREIVTQSPGHATELTRQALHEGLEIIIAAGGDGTVNEVVNGFFEAGKPVNADAALAIVPRGTGTDFVRTFAIPTTPQALLKAIAQWHTRTVDIGRITCKTFDDRDISRLFLNVADCGYGGALLRRFGRYKPYFPGPPAYFLGLLVTLLTYRNPVVSFRIDDGTPQKGRFNSLIAANAQFFGGGMWIAPRAEVNDGLFEIIQLGNINKLEVLLNIRRLYHGTLCQHPKVACVRGKKLQVWSDENVLLDVDGELPGRLPATFEIVPSAMRIMAAEENHTNRISS